MLKIEDLLDKSPYELGKLLLDKHILTNVDDVRLILTLEPIVDVQDKNGERPLHHAARNGNAEFCKTLVDAGAQVNAQSIGGYAPLHIAARGDNLAVLKILLDAGADVNIQDGSGWTPLHWAVNNSNIATSNALLDAGASVDIKNDFGSTPWQLASYKTREKLPQINPNKNQNNASDRRHTLHIRDRIRANAA